MNKSIPNFNFYCQKVIPLIYDDSLSYYETLCKISKVLNDVINAQNELSEQFTKILDFVNSQLENYAKEQLNNWLDDGTLEKIINEEIFGELNAKLDTNIVKTNNNETNILYLDNKTNEIYNSIECVANQRLTDYADLIVDGDYTVALQTAIDKCVSGGVVSLPAGKIKISSTIKLNRYISLEGQGGSTIVGDMDKWVDKTWGSSVPTRALLYVESRVDTQGDHFEQVNSYISNIKITTLGANINSIGIYMGHPNRGSILSPSTVNDCVYGKTLSNLSIYNTDIGIKLAEAWSCKFTNIYVFGTVNQSLLIEGQSVNNFFSDCQFYKRITVTGYTYSTGLKRPEGHTFTGGFIGYDTNAIDFINGLFFTFNSIVLDLCTQSVFVATSPDSVTINNCYIYSDGSYPFIKVNNISTPANNSGLIVTGNSFIGTPNSTSAIEIGNQQSGVNISNNVFHNFSSSPIFIDLKAYSYGNVSGNIFKRSCNNNGVCIQLGSESIYSLIGNVADSTSMTLTNLTGTVLCVSNISSDLNVNGNILRNGVDIMAPKWSTDINNLAPYLVNIRGDSTTIGGPSSAFVGQNLEYDVNFTVQRVTLTSGQDMKRTKVNGSWSEWTPVN